jgi:hypothetical protein
MRSSTPALSLLIVLPCLVGLPIVMASGTTADAQSATGAICCDTATLTCRAANFAPDGGVAKGPKVVPLNSLGVPTSCDPPKGDSIVIEVPGIPGHMSVDPKGLEVEIQTAEPKIRGFEGACLAPFITYTPQAPRVCYRVKVMGITAGLTLATYPYTVVTAPAGTAAPGSVFQPYSTLDAKAPNPDSYQVLLSCYYHNPGSSCPPPSRPVGARSCCDLGSHMTSLDGVYARGFATMATFP